MGWMYGWMDGWMDRWMDEWMSGWMVGWIDGWMDGWMDVYIVRIPIFSTLHVSPPLNSLLLKNDFSSVVSFPLLGSDLSFLEMV